jgi:hypothetical protein
MRENRNRRRWGCRSHVRRVLGLFMSARDLSTCVWALIRAPAQISRSRPAQNRPHRICSPLIICCVPFSVSMFPFPPNALNLLTSPFPIVLERGPSSCRSTLLPLFPPRCLSPYRRNALPATFFPCIFPYYLLVVCVGVYIFVARASTFMSFFLSCGIQSLLLPV